MIIFQSVVIAFHSVYRLHKLVFLALFLSKIFKILALNMGISTITKTKFSGCWVVFPIMAPSQASVKTTFEPSKVTKPYYSGGAGCVALDSTGRLLVTAYGDEVVFTDLVTGSELERIDTVCLKGLL
jgi:hypothetical protein